MHKTLYNISRGDNCPPPLASACRHPWKCQSCKCNKIEQITSAKTTRHVKTRELVCCSPSDGMLSYFSMLPSYSVHLQKQVLCNNINCKPARHELQHARVRVHSVYVTAQNTGRDTAALLIGHCNTDSLLNPNLTLGFLNGQCRCNVGSQVLQCSQDFL